jgi:hypothetical protein
LIWNKIIQDIMRFDMTIINRETLKDIYYAQILSELHTVEEKISIFHGKYKMSFDEFDRNVHTSSEENFTSWDEYMGWKAYEKSRSDLLNKKADIINGNYQIA